MVLLELAQKIGLQPKKVSGMHGGEFKSACPSCGGNDRFILHPFKKIGKCNGTYWCRQCGKKGDTIQFARDFLGLSFQAAINRIGISIQDYRKEKIKPRKLFHSIKIRDTNELWNKKITRLTEWAHEQLLVCSDAINFLLKRGVTISMMKKYKIGLIPRTIYCQKSDWGLPNETDSKKLWIPSGIVIPTWLDKKVVRLRIRRMDWKPDDKIGKYIVLPGSTNAFCKLGDLSNELMIMVESELDAYALHAAVSDLALVVAVGSNIANPDNITDLLAKRKNLLICHDNDKGGMVMTEKLKRLYPHAQIYPTPYGKDVGEAVERGLNLRIWILLYKWIGHKHYDLINFILTYINQLQDKTAYFNVEKKIFAGPESKYFVDGEAIEGFKLIESFILSHK